VDLPPQGGHFILLKANPSLGVYGENAIKPQQHTDAAHCYAVYALPYPSSSGATQIFMFNCDNGAVLSLSPDNSWRQYRDIPASLWPTANFCGAMSMAGTATMLMLEPENGYAAEVVMF
jgi:hypothetical protein